MKFDTILEYQKIDGELIKLEAEFSKGKERSALVAAKAKLEAATETVGKLSQEAADLLAGYNKLSARAAELKSRLDEFDGILDASPTQTRRITTSVRSSPSRTRSPLSKRTPQRTATASTPSLPSTSAPGSRA